MSARYVRSLGTAFNFHLVSLFDSSKFDPYERGKLTSHASGTIADRCTEEAAANFLKAEPTDSRLPPPSASVKQEAGASAIKPEPSGPSEELRREYQEYQQTQRARIVKEEQAVKGEPHRPSAELVAEFNDYQNTRSQQGKFCRCVTEARILIALRSYSRAFAVTSSEFCRTGFPAGATAQASNERYALRCSTL